MLPPPPPTAKLDAPEGHLQVQGEILRAIWRNHVSDNHAAELFVFATFETVVSVARAAALHIPHLGRIVCVAYNSFIAAAILGALRVDVNYTANRTLQLVLRFSVRANNNAVHGQRGAAETKDKLKCPVGSVIHIN